jgi:GntR family transcriptional regulator / MocR family aminotransferase
MRGWNFTVSIDPRASVPIFTQIAHAIAGDIRRGRLRPGDVMPGTRTLARTLAVHRNTVIAAYAELSAEGWITTETGRGTFVSATLPDPRPRRFAAPGSFADDSVDAFELGPDPEDVFCGPQRDHHYNLSGWPDSRLVPTKALARAWRRAIERRSNQVLSYGDNAGHPRLRSALARMLSATRGVVVDGSRVLVTRGTQGAIATIAHALFRPGDVVAVENPGYRRAWQMMSLLGVRLVPIPVDENGLSTDYLSVIADEHRIRAVFVTPHHQFPTTVTLSTARRLRLLDLARQHRFIVIEDDFDHEFHYEGRPILPLASADARGSVVYVGSLSKTLAPGLRLGYVAATARVIDHLTKYRTLLDTQGDHVLEAAVAELVEDGEVQRHVRRMQRTYRERRDVMASLLKTELGDAVSVTVPAGGTALWVRVTAAVDIDRWCRAAADHQVFVESGDRFSFDGQPLRYIRVGYATHGEAELAEAVRRLAAALAIAGSPVPAPIAALA